MKRERKLYILGWPGAIGGASTKLAHLLRLLHRRFLTVIVPNEPEEANDAPWRGVLSDLGVTVCPFEELPEKLEGWGLALCNFEILISPKWAELRRRGLKMTWSNEMMWTHPGELGAVFTGLVDQILYVSEVQREYLEPVYVMARTGSVQPVSLCDPTASWGEVTHCSGRHLRWAMTGNYVDPVLFPEREQRVKGPAEPLIIGRLSRPDPAKFPEDFPAFYEGLGVPNAKFRVMAWEGAAAAQWNGHLFDERWELLPALKEDADKFLRSLDLFVYSLGATVQESWGRCVVEAMLSGVVPLLPDSRKHHLRNLVKHGESGFLCRDAAEFGHYARMLDTNRELLHACARQAREDAVNRLCCEGEHLRLWESAFPDLSVSANRQSVP